MPTRVLLVDDNFDSIDILAGLLMRHGFEVRCSNDPLGAVEVAQAFEPHCICLDIGMPILDGYTLALRLRKVPSLRDCRIIAVSGLPPDPERLAKAGIDLHLLKPVAASVLAKVLCPTATEAS